MGNLPADSNDIIALKSRNKIKLLLLIAAAVVLSVIIGLAAYLIFSKFQPSNPFQLSESTFKNSSKAAIFNDLTKTGLKSKDQDQKYDSLYKAFSILAIDYTAQPAVEKRLMLDKIADYLKQEFPQGKNNYGLVIPCKEEACGAVARYTPELEDLRRRAEDNPVLTDEIKSSFLVNLDNAAFAFGKDNEDGVFAGLNAAFITVRYAWKTSNDTSLEELAKDTLALMEKTDPDTFRSGQEKGFYKL